MKDSAVKLWDFLVSPYRKHPWRAVYLLGALIFLALSELGVFRATWKEVAISLIVFVVVSV